MGDIIEIKFGGGSGEKKPENPTAETQDVIIKLPGLKTLEEKETPSSLPRATKESMDLLMRALRQIPKMREFLNGLHAMEKRETIRLRQELVTQMSVVEKCEAVANSSETDWGTHPTYYRVLMGHFNPTSITEMFAQLISAPDKSNEPDKEK